MPVAGSDTLGVMTELVSDEFRVFLVDRKDRRRWDIARLDWWADYDDPASFLDIFSWNYSQNDLGYSSPDFNRLMDGLRAELDAEKRVLLLVGS